MKDVATEQYVFVGGTAEEQAAIKIQTQFRGKQERTLHGHKIKLNLNLKKYLDEYEVNILQSFINIHNRCLNNKKLHQNQKLIIHLHL